MEELREFTIDGYTVMATSKEEAIEIANELFDELVAECH